MKTREKTISKNLKNGISLIVLVITIIVMIILASTIILNLNGINIIERAKQAVRESNRKQIETLAQTIWSDGYLENKTEATIKEEIVKAVGKDKADDFNIVVTNMGVIVENFPESWESSVSEVINDVPIPKGFVISPYRGENTVNEGLVIYALSKEEIDDGVYDITKIDEDYQYSLENRNQFVWVPVSRENFVTEFVRDRFQVDYDSIWTNAVVNDYWYSNILGGDSSEEGYFWEVELDSENMPKETQSNMSFMSDATLKEVIAMYNSVKKYGGFYLGRYEAGGTMVDETTNFGIGTLSVTMSKVPYNGVPWANSTTMNWDKGGAVELARSLYQSTNLNYGAVSTLTYGVQWDKAIAWIKSRKGEEISLINSESYGNFSNTPIEIGDFNDNAKYVSMTYNESAVTTGYFEVGTWTNATEYTTKNGTYMLTTGALKKANLCNIYDMAGNVIEWTMEGYKTNTRNRRGGSFYGAAKFNLIAIRGNNQQWGRRAETGFRLSLYIK